MRNRNDIAEDVLSQVAPPEQAKTIVGDLLEAQHETARATMPARHKS